MASLHTLPLPVVAVSHEHAWLIDSRHPTSEGWVLYVRCAECGTRRVDMQTHAAMPPQAVSTTLR